MSDEPVISLGVGFLIEDAFSCRNCDMDPKFTLIVKRCCYLMLYYSFCFERFIYELVFRWLYFGSALAKIVEDINDVPVMNEK